MFGKKKRVSTASAKTFRVRLHLQNLEQREVCSTTPLAAPMHSPAPAIVQTVLPAAAKTTAAAAKAAYDRGWATAEGRALIEQWIGYAMGKVNAYNGSASF